MNVSNIITRNYKNFIPLAGQKNKPNSNPIHERPKMNVKPYNTMKYKKFARLPGYKNKPNQTQLPNAAAAGRIMFLLFLFLNLMVGYVDKNV